MFDGVSFDPFTLYNDGLGPTELGSRTVIYSAIAFDPVRSCVAQFL
jgi:hypothetical protein